MQVILIHLSNLSGLKNDYSKRTMRLLVSRRCKQALVCRGLVLQTLG